MICRADFSGLAQSAEGGAVSMWMVSAMTSWSFYQKCLFGEGRDKCKGTDTIIGPEGSEFRFQLDDSCGTPKGARFSMPRRGQCKQVQAPSHGGCSFVAPRIRRG